MSTLLVTGGAGFIGCNLVRLALGPEAPFAVERLVVLDKLTYAGSLENLRAVEDDPRFAFVHGDIAERATVERVFREHRPTAVLNFAAESHVDRSIDDPSDFVETNVRGCFELLEGARRQLAGAGEAERAAFRFLHVSTDEVYGSLGPTGAFVETTPYAPRSPYAASKAAADHLARAYFHTYGLPVLVSNCSNNYGPYQFPEKLIPLMTLNAAEGKDLPIYGDGANVRDWLHVEDHCRGLLTVLERAAPGSSYNLGGESERTNLQVVDALCAALEAAYPAATNPALAARGAAAYRDLRVFVRDRPGHDRRYAIDPTAIRAELGWRPRHDFESGLAATVGWYLDHRAWCETVQHEGSRERLGLGGAR
ncbi:MAG TPA: dTDP-glucose 4,6-dehydratase [Thermoanaerobaculia bacterium]|nr:dTDP-glucose 4,6-dehydratase [Thermoanaerobaculia bacterium]